MNKLTTLLELLHKEETEVVLMATQLLSSIPQGRFKKIKDVTYGDVITIEFQDSDLKTVSISDYAYVAVFEHNLITYSAGRKHGFIHLVNDELR